MAQIVVATCQFPVSAEVDANLRWITRQTRTAAARGATIAHFPEGALSGYAGVDVATFAGYDWSTLRRAAEDLLDLARRLRIWLVIGSAHPLTEGRKPHNSVYVIDPEGSLVDRYDKRFCSGNHEGNTGDLAHYSPGDHSSVWEIDGIRCGALICYDYRFPELHREYARAGVQLVFHSFHAANYSPNRVATIGETIGTDLRPINRAATFTYPAITMPASMTTAAAAGHMWISAANSSTRESLWPAFVVRSDGVTAGRLRRNVPGVLVTEVDTAADVYDSTGPWRHRALHGTLHSGDPIDDPRSRDRTSL